MRGDTSRRALSLVFTAHDHADGADSIIAVLDRHGAKGAFFFTGLFYDTYPQVISRLKEKGHYLGSHSDGHLLYLPWGQSDTMLVSRQQFADDMEACYAKMAKAGITREDAPVFIPPYEHYNDSISLWAQSIGLQVVNYTPGTWSNADYTTPEMSNYRSSRAIYERILNYEDSLGLNGHIMLIHFGTDSMRADKFYNAYLDSTLCALEGRGYQILPLMELITESPSDTNP